MKKRVFALALAAAVVFAIPVAASADEGDEARPERRPRVAIDERFDTVEEAVAAVTERLASALERLTARYDGLQDNEVVSEDVFEHLSMVIDHVEATLDAVAAAGDFDELQDVLDAAREQRREDRESRPIPPRGFRRGFGSGQETADAEA